MSLQSEYFHRISVLGVLFLAVPTVTTFGFTAHAAETGNTADTGSAKLIGAQAYSELRISPRHRSPAKVIALNNSELRSELNARILKIPVHVGDIVKTNQIIATLDCTDYKLKKEQEQAQLASLEAELALAKYQLDRANTLSSKQVMSEELLKQRETELLISQAKIGAQKVNVRQAQRNINKCLVRAPYKAVVVKKLGQVGELLSPGMPIVQITDAVQIEVSSMVQTDLVEQFADSKDIVFSAHGKDYALSLRSITPTIETRERTQEVRFTFNGEKPLPGAAGEIFWTNPHSHIPSEFLIKRGEQMGIFVVRNNNAHFHPIANAVSGRSAPLDLSDKTLIVTEGRYRLQDGDSVRLQ